MGGAPAPVTPSEFQVRHDVDRIQRGRSRALLANLNAPCLARRTRLAKPASYADIRSVDFRNAEYPSGCSGLIRDPRFGAVIHVKNGEWKTGPNASDAYFSVNHVFYDDVDGDGRAEAIVTTACSIYGANYWETEVYVFQLADGQARLVQRLSSNDWYGPEGGYRVAAVGVLGHEIRVSYLAGGSHAQPAWEITAGFKWNGNRFVRAHTDRRAFKG